MNYLKKYSRISLVSISKGVDYHDREGICLVQDRVQIVYYLVGRRHLNLVFLTMYNGTISQVTFESRYIIRQEECHFSDNTLVSV